MSDVRIPDIVLEKDRVDLLEPIITRIVEMLNTMRRDIVVAINGAAPNVGKTYVASALHALLMRRNIESVDSNDYLLESQIDVLQELKRVNNPQPGVVIMSAYMDDGSGEKSDFVDRLKELKDSRIADYSKGKFNEVDMWIAIYRNDRRFSHPFVLGDVLIRNDGAKNKTSW
ncbi:hypothetical protein HYZ99_05620 [Candidatus Peregrinibacteria bacterium]|nr:hypothetical protein [Candidatus Peregrinibacteria bacterium]